MMHLRCHEISKGLRASESIVTVKDWQGKKDFLRLETGMIFFDNGFGWLPVGEISEDKSQNVVLIEYPQESERGNWRIWASTTDLLEYQQATV